MKRNLLKRTISMVLAIILVMSVIPENVYAEENQTTGGVQTIEEDQTPEGDQTTPEVQNVASGTCGESLEWVITPNYNLIISGSGEMDDYWNANIDKELKLAPWAEYAAEIQNVVIGEGVTKIGKYAFINFTSLTEVTIPNNVTYIGQSAFYGDAALTEMTLPFIGQGEGAKYNQTSLLSHLFAGAEYEGGVKCSQTSTDQTYYYDFYLPAGLKKITLNGSDLFGGAFSGCVTLEEIILNGEIPKIESRTFKDCKNLKEIIIPKSVTEIDQFAFDGCEAMTSFTILSDFTCRNTSFDSDYVEEIGISCEVFEKYYDKTTNQWIKNDFQSWMSVDTFIPCYRIHTEVNDNLCVKCNTDIKEEQEDVYQQLESYYQADQVVLGRNTFSSEKSAFTFTAPYEDLYTFNIPEGNILTKLSLDGNKVIKSKVKFPYSVHLEKGERMLAMVETIYQSKPEYLTITNLLGKDCGELIAFGKVNEKIKWRLEETGTIILEGTGEVPDYEHNPAYPVNSTDEYYNAAPPWFRYAEHIKRLKVEEGITKLGEGTFCDGDYVMYYVSEEAEGGEWVRPADGVFHSIDIALESIELATSVVELDHCFTGGLSKNLRDYDVPGTVKKIGPYTFTSNTRTRFTIQEGVEIIGDRAFEGHLFINQSKLPDSITYIGKQAFMNCEFLNGTVILPKSLEEIVEDTFNSCETLKKVILPEGLKIIGENAFIGCINLEEVNFPESLEKIGNRCFARSNLKSLKFGSNVKEIGVGAFSKGRYSYVKIPGMESLPGAFSMRTSLDDDYDPIKDAKGLQTIVVSEGMKSIDSLGGSKWGRIVLPKSVTYLNYKNYGDTQHNCIGTAQFSDFFLPTLYIYRGTYVDKLFNNMTLGFGHYFKYIIAAGDCGYNTYFVLTEDNELVLLGEGAMDDYERAEDAPWHAYADRIENIEISRDITSIGDKAFEGCTNLKSIYYPIMKYDWDIKEYLFVDNLEKVGKDAFKGCDQFVFQCHVDSSTNQYIYKQKLEVPVVTEENKCGENSYWNIDSEGTLRISGTGNIADYGVKKAPWYFCRASVKNVVLGEGIQGIGDYAFYGCYNLLNVEGMETIQSVGSHAFDGCTKLTGLELSENCEDFAISSIMNCKKLKNFYLPKSIVEVSDLEEYSEKVPFFVVEDEFALEELFDEYEVRYRRESDILVENIVIRSEKETFNIQRQTSTSLSAEVYPENATNDSVKWKSSNPTVAEVDESGEVTFYGAGSVYISAASQDGTEIFTEKRIEIVDEQLVETIALNQNEVTLNKNINQYTVLTASFAGQEINKNSILWSSSDKSVVNVQNGIIFAVGEGVAEIKCVSKEDETIYAVCRVEVHCIDKVTIEPTCEEDGCIQNQCSMCSKVISIESELGASGHTWSVWLTEKEATCKEQGLEKRTCTECKKEETQKIEILTHKDKNHDEQCDYCGIPMTSEDESKENEVARLFGSTRYETGYKVADALKEQLGVEKFEAAIVATGKNFADALAGSYLAVEKNAPILLTNGKDDNIAQLHAYIKANVAVGGKVYILGGEGAVPVEADAIEGYEVVRLYGDSRYDTNLAILKEGGVSGDAIIVATGKNFADSLSASAARLPILLVKPNAVLNDDQKAILSGMKNIYIIGGEGAVSISYENELKEFGEVTRVFGQSRYDTSVEVAKTFCGDVEKIVVASGKNFPDGLCGGPLAVAMNVPLILTTDGKTAAATNYVVENEISAGYVLGGDGALSDQTVVNVFHLKNASEIKEFQ